MTKAIQVLEALRTLTESVDLFKVKSRSKVTNFDTRKTEYLNPGNYELINTESDGTVLISDEKGNLYYITQ